MNYIQVIMTAKHGDTDNICAMLMPFAEGFVIDDPMDVYEFSLEKSTKWDYIDDKLLGDRDRDVTVTVYLEEDDKGRQALSDILETMKRERPDSKITVNGVKSEDWENNWKQYFKPFKVGNRLLVRPSWEEIENEDDRKVLTIDPASSFGTGSHATTRLCLDEIDGADLEGKTVLDVGCGSGILITAMLLMGADKAIGCDIEENAVKTTAENILKNDISKEKFSVYRGDLMSDKALYDKLKEQKYHMICANIVADVLKNMCDFLLSSLEDDGILIISGIIEERTEEVRDYYIEHGAKIDKIITKDGWSMIKISRSC